MTRRRTLLAGLSLALAVLLSLGGMQAAQALWSTSAAASGTVSSGTVAATMTGFSGLSTTLTPASGATVDAVTITNTGSLPLTTVSGRLTATGTATSTVTVTLWALAAGTTSCPSTPPSGAATGSWASPPAWPALASTLGSQSSATYCVRTSTTTATSASITASLAVDAADRSWSAPTITDTAAQTVVPATGSSTTVTAAQGGIAPEPGTGTAITNVTFTPMSATGTVDPYYFCVTVTAGSPDGTPTKWGFTGDTTKPPYNALPQAGNWQWPSNVRVSGPDSAGLATVNGGNSDYNVKGTVDVQFCITTRQAHLPAVMPESATTYFVSAPVLASCASRSQPATRTDACVWTDVTGLYPHFYIGFTYSFDLRAVIDASALGSDLKTHLRNDTITGFETAFGGTSWSSSGTTYTFSSDGRGPNDGGITAGDVKTVKARLSTNG